MESYEPDPDQFEADHLDPDHFQEGSVELCIVNLTLNEPFSLLRSRGSSTVLPAGARRHGSWILETVVVRGAACAQPSRLGVEIMAKRKRRRRIRRKGASLLRERMLCLIRLFYPCPVLRFVQSAYTGLQPRIDDTFGMRDHLQMRRPAPTATERKVQQMEHRSSSPEKASNSLAAPGIH
jgi:hypothetical protein